MGLRRRLQATAVVAFLVAYPVLSHYSISTSETHGWAVALALGPILSVALLLIWRWAHPSAALLAAAAAALLLLHYWPLLERNLSQRLHAAGMRLVRGDGLELRAVAAPRQRRAVHSNRG